MRAPARLALAGLLVGLAVVVAAMTLAGTTPEAAPPGIPDPGPFVGWALPIARLLTDLGAVATVGFLLVAVLFLPSGAQLQGLSVQAVRLASWTAIGWAVAGTTLLVLNVSDVFARPVNGLNVNLIGSFVIDFAPGRAFALQVLGAIIVAVVCRWTLAVRPLAVTLGIAVATVVPVAFAGHAANAGSHTLAVFSLMLHLVGIVVWVGGLLALAWVALRGSKRLHEAIVRYSPIALWAFVTVGASGVINAAIRLGSWSQITSSYGLLVVAKTGALVALGAFGFLQRRRIVAAGSGFARLAVTELFVMISAMALAVVLSRTPTPVGEDVLQTPAERLLGAPMPEEPTVARIFLGWSANGFGLVFTVFALALYVTGLVVLRRRGDRWPIGRTVSWCVGVLVVAWATIGGIGEYSHVMFSMHMISHMMLSMIAPIFLVLGAPITLALRTLPGARRPGEHSPRALLMAFVHSRLARFFTHPVVAAIIFMGSLYALYFSSLFEVLMRTHSGHVFMEAHFLLAGVLFYYVVIGVDPSPRSVPPLVRFGLLMISIPFHAFFSVAVMGADYVIAEGFYTALDRPFATDLLADQYLGGGIAWATGEVPLVLVMAAIFVQWFRSDSREARRLDRKADRDHDAELEKYNAYLQSLDRK
ncbi:copper resistance protein CopD [Aeromicrobium phragmitis]|uniref:Copper resistance protein CopD n=1 Tax=Aeromicrobium phragmitis TaxID=2478914 RepID=A0A3L8PNI2_9ACTN|nr:cytochrome c oxidase assembly protein [Aeromicrobium phragmitis]RLV55542.1 copper resistance protein CopD [Aeromicrobium phragmitis]